MDSRLLSLEELANLARKFGHSGDHICTVEFVQFVFEKCGEKPPTEEELAPFPDDDEED